MESTSTGSRKARLHLTLTNHLRSHLWQFADINRLSEPLFEDQEFVTEDAGLDDWLVPGWLTSACSIGLFLRSNWFHRTVLAILEVNGCPGTNRYPHCHRFDQASASTRTLYWGQSPDSGYLPIGRCWCGAATQPAPIRRRLPDDAPVTGCLDIRFLVAERQQYLVELFRDRQTGPGSTSS